MLCAQSATSSELTRCRTRPTRRPRESPWPMVAKQEEGLSEVRGCALACDTLVEGEGN